MEGSVPGFTSIAVIATTQFQISLDRSPGLAVRPPADVWLEPRLLHLLRIHPVRQRLHALLPTGRLVNVIFMGNFFLSLMISVHACLSWFVNLPAFNIFFSDPPGVSREERASAPVRGVPGSFAGERNFISR